MRAVIISWTASAWDEIDPAVEEGPARELPRLGGAGPCPQDGLQHLLADEGAAVAVDLQGFFTGEGVWRPKQGDEDLVEDASRGGADDFSVVEPVGPAGLRRFSGPEKGVPDPFGVGAACPNDPDAARAGRCGNRSYGVCLDHRGGLGPWGPLLLLGRTMILRLWPSPRLMVTTVSSFCRVRWMMRLSRAVMLPSVTGFLVFLTFWLTFSARDTRASSRFLR